MFLWYQKLSDAPKGPAHENVQQDKKFLTSFCDTPLCGSPENSNLHTDSTRIVRKHQILPEKQKGPPQNVWILLDKNVSTFLLTLPMVYQIFFAPDWWVTSTLICFQFLLVSSRKYLKRKTVNSLVQFFPFPEIPGVTQISCYWFISSLPQIGSFNHQVRTYQII